METGEDPYRLAVEYLSPALSHFAFIPSHVIGTNQDQLPAMDFETKLQIIKLEREKNFERATTVFFNWLLTTPPLESKGLCPFLDVLLKDTPEHQHVHNIVCLCSVYLPGHRDLLRSLARRLAEGTVQMQTLVSFLIAHRLLDPERAPSILNIAQACAFGCASKQSCERAVTFLMASIYAALAKILEETSGTENKAASRACSQSLESTPSRQRSDVIARPSADVMARVTRGTNQGSNPESNPSATSKDEAPQPVAWVVQVDRLGLSPLELERLEGLWPERWPDLLVSALSQASTADREWPYALCPQEVHSLWNQARRLIQRGQRVSSGTGQAVTATSDQAAFGPVDPSVSTDDATSDAGSGDSGATLRAGITTNNNDDMILLYNNSNCKLHPKDKELPISVLQRNKDVEMNRFLASDPDDASSISSIETNSRLRGRNAEDIRRGGGGGWVDAGGVLREEEIRELKSGPIRLRPYQDELLESARKGQNVLIWLPTGTGKTYIVLKYAEEHLAADPGRRVVFVVPKVRLARQQYERFVAYMPQFHPHLKCGETSGTASGKQPLGEVLKTSRVVVVTGQSLVEAVERGRVSLDMFSLLVLDECHHTRGGHPLRVLMNQYMKAKLQDRLPRLPQVMGLTASPGVGKARGKEVEDAVRYLKQLCARLDVYHICNVRHHLQDLQQYVHQPLTGAVECQPRKVDRLKTRLEMLMKAIEDSMTTDCELEKVLQTKADHGEKVLRQLTAPQNYKGQDQYKQWLANAKKALQEINERKAFYVVNAHIQILELCHRCLVLNEDCDSLGALKLFQSEVDLLFQQKPSDADKPQRPVDQKILEIIETYISDRSTPELPSIWQECRRRDCQNPKLKFLEDLLLNSSKDDPDTTERKQPAAHTENGHDLTSQETLLKQLAHHPLAHPSNVSGTEREETAGVLPEKEDEEEEEEEDQDDSETVCSDISDVYSITGDDLDYLDKVRGMIFVRTLDLSKALLDWMRQHPKLAYLNPDRITGVNASVKNGGMTKGEVTSVMSRFNEGAIKVVICTSAAEEGLDFKACNFVIRYLYEASMVSMIQIRGRARDEHSRYSVLGDCNTLGKEKDNVESELAMSEAVVRIQQTVDRDLDAHMHAIRKMQMEAWNNRWRKDVDERKRLNERLGEGVYRLLCRGCRLPACSSADIRILRKTNRTVIGAEFSNKYIRKHDDQTPHDQKRSYDEKIPRTGKLHCKSCGFYWGIIVRSVDDGVEFPVIPIKSFLVEDAAGEIRSIDKWSKAFNVLELGDEDLLRHSEPLLGAEDRLEGDAQPEEEEDERGHRREDLEMNSLDQPEGQRDEGRREEDPERSLRVGWNLSPGEPGLALPSAEVAEAEAAAEAVAAAEAAEAV